MLKHDCKECGKRLAEAAATCPNCGAPKPLDGWRQVKAPARSFAAAAQVFLCLVVTVYALSALYHRFASDSTPKIEPGMHFDLDRKGTYACSTLARLSQLSTYVRKKDDLRANAMMDSRSHNIGDDFCWNSTRLSSRYEVDEVIGTDEGRVVSFHSIEDYDSPLAKYYAPLSLVRPWELFASAPADKNTKPSDVKVGMKFTVYYSKDFIACEKIENLIKLSGYIASGDKESTNHMLAEYSAPERCIDQKFVHPGEALEVTNVEERKDVGDVFVAFDHVYDHYYTSIKFVNAHKTTNDRLDEVNGNVTMTAMNSTIAMTGPINFALDKAIDVSGWFDKATQDHPILSAVGLGSLTIGSMWGKAKGIGKLFGAGDEAGDARLMEKTGGKWVFDLVKNVPRFLAASLRSAMAWIVEMVPMALEVAGGIAVSEAAVIGAGALLGVALGKLLTDAVDHHIQESSEYTLSSTRDWLAHTSFGKRTGWFDFGQNEALHFVQAPPLKNGSSSQKLPEETPDFKKIPAKGSMNDIDDKDTAKKIADKTISSTDKAANINVSVYMDSKEISSHMVASNSHGTSGLNVAAMRLTPNSNLRGGVA